ncbi:MAG: response regulator [Bacteroidia bacterium]|nr:response regulator [Bacteroidia bacterium]
MIYVVEDNDAIRETICSYLELSDYEVEQFSTVASVVESLEFKKAQLCILDVMLPDGNGFFFSQKGKREETVVTPTGFAGYISPLFVPRSYNLVHTALPTSTKSLFEKVVDTEHFGFRYRGEPAGSL